MNEASSGPGGTFEETEIDPSLGIEEAERYLEEQDETGWLSEMELADENESSEDSSE